MEKLVLNQVEGNNHFKIENGQPFVSSLYIAEVTGKEHFHIMRDIKKILTETDKEFNQTNFGLVSYKDRKGEFRPMYWLSEDGSSVVLGGYSIQHRVKIQKELRDFKENSTISLAERLINKIEDVKERTLSLKLYKLEEIMKLDATDFVTAFQYANCKTELELYKQSRQLKLIEKEKEEIKQELDTIVTRVDNLFVIGDRVQFNNEVHSVARATGTDYDVVYSLVYSKLKDMYGIDVATRSQNKQKKLQEERIQSGKKPYSTSSLSSKAGKITIIEECGLWNEVAKALMAVKDELLQQGKKLRLV